MKTNHEDRKRLVDYLSGELDPGEAEAVMAHRKDCPPCRAEEARLKKILDAVSARRTDAERVMAAIDWDKLALRIADVAESKASAFPAKTVTRPGYFGWLLRPALAYLLIGLLIGGLAMFGVFRAGLLTPSSRGGYIASRDFLDRTELELARRETVNYLEQSQYLLLDFAQAPPDKAGRVWEKGFPSQQAADLISRKKYINAQLDKIPMSKAREICDQIEALFLELGQIGGRLNEAQWQEIQGRVEQSQLLLKIQLVKKELQSREI
jgi:hypothetical protein